MKTSKSRVAVLGATGLVGQQFVRLLNDHPFFEPVLLTGSSRSAGKKYEEVTTWFLRSEMPEYARNRLIMETSIANVLHHDVDTVFIALPSKIARKLEQSLANEGMRVFTNTNCHRMDENVPILIPEINDGHSDIIERQDYDNGFIVTN
ncbi:MAG: aspartate-semialdehyde dehydrogenase, partial [Candidatus Hodarchaeales archaeon]